MVTSTCTYRSRSTTHRPVLAILALALALLLTTPQLVRADNSKDASRVVVCAYNYPTPSDQHGYELAVLDKTNSPAERESIERMMKNWAVTESAAHYHHEYVDYAMYPSSVLVTDLLNWRCTWTEGNTPKP